MPNKLTNVRSKSTRLKDVETKVKIEHTEGKIKNAQRSERRVGAGNNKTRKLDYWYVVAAGRRPGIYNDDTEAVEAVDKFEGQAFCKFRGREAAVKYLRERGFLDEDIRINRNPFVHRTGYTPNPQAPFLEEIERLCSSQPWSQLEKSQAKVDSIRDEIIRYFLPGGVRLKPKREHKDDEVELDDDETLSIYRGMCKTAGKQTYSSIDSCLLELKRPPFVNIIDFVDAYRIGQPVHTFSDWKKFKKYTSKGRAIELSIAKDSEFLAPLLQNLRKGPDTNDPRKERKHREAARERELVLREAQQFEDIPIKCSQELPRSLSPSVFDRVITRSQSPEPVSRPSTLGEQDVLSRSPHLKIESSNTSALQLDQTPPQLSANHFSPTSDISDSEFIELSNKIEASARAPGFKDSPLSSPIPTSDISDRDWIELSMRLDAATQDPTVTMDRPSIKQPPSTAPAKTSKKRSLGSPLPTIYHSKRLRKDNAL